MNREAIYQRLLTEVTALKAAPYTLRIAEVSRFFKHWHDAADQPAIYIVPTRENAVGARGQPRKWTFMVDLWIYAKKEGELLGVQQLNPILDAVEAIFSPKDLHAPHNAYVNTLGGLVSSCMISGDVEISGGYLGEQSVALVPLQIVVT